MFSISIALSMVLNQNNTNVAWSLVLGAPRRLGYLLPRLRPRFPQRVCLVEAGLSMRFVGGIRLGVIAWREWWRDGWGWLLLRLYCDKRECRYVRWSLGYLFDLKVIINICMYATNYHAMVSDLRWWQTFRSVGCEENHNADDHHSKIVQLLSSQNTIGV